MAAVKAVRVVAAVAAASMAAAVVVEISVTPGAVEIWVAVVRRQQAAGKQVVEHRQAVEHPWAVDRRTTIFRSSDRVHPLVTM